MQCCLGVRLFVLVQYRMENLDIIVFIKENGLLIMGNFVVLLDFYSFMDKIQVDMLKLYNIFNNVYYS